MDELRKLQHKCLTRAFRQARQSMLQFAQFVHMQGLTFQQIGTQLGISVSLAHQLVRDALTYCAEQLSDD